MAGNPERRLRGALGSLRAGDWGAVERVCQEILKEAPRHPDTLHLLGVAHLGLRKFASAEALFRDALEVGASQGALYMRLGIALSSQGKLADAEVALREAAARSPDDPDVHVNLGNTLAERGEPDQALACYNRVLELQPDNALAHFNIGNLHRMGGRMEQAAAAYRRVLAVAPGDADTHNNLGLVLEQQQRLDEAGACYLQALVLRPDHVHALSNLGNVLRAQGRNDEAVSCYERAIAVSPNHIDAHINLGIVRAQQGRHAEAQALYEKALRLDPGSFEAHYSLGGLLKLQGRLEEAIAHYRRALDIAPKRALAYSGLGAACRQAGDLDTAVACFRKASELDPGHAGIRFDLAETYKLQGALDQAIESCERTLAIDPDHLAALGGSAHLRQHACSWQGIEALWQRLREKIAAGTAGQLSPFGVISMPTSAAEQLECARAWAQRELAPIAAVRAGLGFDFSGRAARGRLRIGYLSWGFHTHVTSYWAAELLELHDRGRFEVFGYGYGPDDRSEIRARIRGACDRFADLAGESHLAAARRIYDDGVDVLVDLTGYTLGGRPQIAALRPAPVQVNWFYPGTMGTDCMDYFIADPCVVPPGLEPFFTEKIVRLPHCYMVTDSRRVASGETPTRGQCGLPEEGLVLCCFNQAYKILPETFDIWMRIMRAVPQSVLWLAEANPWATENLRREALARGVAAERLVIARRRSLADYLAQYRLADLALDTYPYTSHTTAADALWMECPLVTRAGETFASRVAASVLISGGLSELVTDNARDYERKVVELATSPGRLQDLRRRLRESRASCPLFDTPRFVRDLEHAYQMMFNAFLGRGS